MQRRHVRRPARPIEDYTPGLKGHVKRFFLSFTPKYFASYWLGRQGLIRLGKLAGAGFLFIFLVFLWYAKDLPTPGKINSKLSAQTTKFYDSSGQHLLYELLGDKNRSIIKYEDIPAVTKNAVISIEDKDFYKHGSFSFWGYLRAAVENLTTGTRQGGSTITQQYVKNALLDPTDFSYSRKIKELILSIEIGQFYSKNDIITLYLNEIPFGARAYGVESACKSFFPMDIDEKDVDKRCAKNLNLGQSALLAAILNAPSYYSPYGTHTDRLIVRQNLVLDLMVDQHYITKDEATAAKWTEADLKDKTKISQEPNLYANLDPSVAHFVLYAQDFLEAKYGTKTVTEGGLKVTTTLDWDKQKAAYDAVKNNMNNVTALGGSNAALVSTDPKSGHILAMIGSQNFNDPNGGQVNVATSLRQPGSSFKPIVYATMFAKNKDASCAKNRECSTYGPGTTLYDVPTNFGTDANPYTPQNYGNKTYGIVTARSALAGSLNRPAVKALAISGLNNALQTAQSLGITTLKSSTDYGLSLVLGSGEVQLVEMANAYESFANGGQHYEQTPILVLKDQRGKTMEDNTKAKKPKQAIDPQVAYLMADVMSDNNAKRYVFANSLDLRNACGNNSARGCVHYGVKTGTTEHFNDAWTVGYTQDITAGVWVGNNDNKPMNSAAANIAAPIWRSYMNTVLNGKANDAFVRPSGIKTVTLDKRTGRLPIAGTQGTYTDIFPSWYTPMSAAGGKTAQVDKLSGKLATECTPDLAKETVSSSAILPELLRSENPSQYDSWLSALIKAGYSTSGSGDLPTDYDDKHHCSDDKPTVQIQGLNGGGPYSFTVHVESGTFPANKLQVYFDDQIISTQVINGSGDFDISCSSACGDPGNHTFKAVVTDAGYYQASDSQTVHVTYSGGGGSLSAESPGNGDQETIGSILFTWTDSGASSYTLYVDGASKGTTTGTSRSANVLTIGNHTWYVRDSDGNQSNTVNFKTKP